MASQDIPQWRSLVNIRRAYAEQATAWTRDWQELFPEADFTSQSMLEDFVNEYSVPLTGGEPATVPAFLLREHDLRKEKSCTMEKVSEEAELEAGYLTGVVSKSLEERDRHK
jgi:hypothetical protein